MSQSPRKRASSAVIAFALAVTASACVEQDDPGVAVTKVEARLAFGVKDIPKEAPKTPGQALFESAEADEELLLPDLPISRQPRPIPSRGGDDDNDTSLCPEPAENGADVAATDNVTSLPVEGIYQWHVATVEIDPSDKKTTKEQITRRAVRRVKEVDQSVFTFETVEPVAQDRFLVTLWQAKKDGKTVFVNTGSGVVPPPKGGEPERGIVVKSRRMIDGKGDSAPDARPYQPMTGLLTLPLPVSPSESYTTVGVDSRTGDTETRTTTIGSHAFVNACGDYIDAWLSSAGVSYTMTNGQSAQYNLDMYFAPQYGGIPVQVVERFSVGANQFQVFSTQIGLKPEPLPESLK